MLSLRTASRRFSKTWLRYLSRSPAGPCSTGNISIPLDARDNPNPLHKSKDGPLMEALVKQYPKPGLWNCKVDRPFPGQDDVLIRVQAASLCGTDLHIYQWDEWSRSVIKPPVVLGHEYMGEVEELGENVKGFSKGERVTAEGHITCGHCRNCRAADRRHLCKFSEGVGITRHGGFAEYVTVPAQNVVKLHNDIKDDMAACMDPLGNAVHAALSFDLVGEDVLVTGSGPIGIMSVGVARMVGARRIVVTDVSDYRLKLALAVGADAVINVSDDKSMWSTMRKLGMTEGFDVGLEMSGRDTAFAAMIEHMRNGGKIACLGLPARPIPVEMSKVILRGLSIKGIYGREMFETWYKMSNLLVAGLQDQLKPVITHHFVATDGYLEALKLMESGKSGKIILSWT